MHFSKNSKKFQKISKNSKKFQKKNQKMKTFWKKKKLELIIMNNFIDKRLFQN